jgi:Family of unknown function (DUF6101)
MIGARRGVNGARMMGRLLQPDRLTPKQVTAACARSEDGIKRVNIGAEWICIRRRIGGLETWVNVPTSSYRGVTLRTAEGGLFEIALLHVDPSLDLVLARAPDDTDVIALWRSYGRIIGLPLLAEDQNGRLQPMADGPVVITTRRRMGSSLRQRRPRFLARRLVGSPGVAEVHRGETELVAQG